MQKPISIQLPLLSHSSVLGDLMVAVHGELVQNLLHGERPQNLAHWKKHGTVVVADNRQTLAGVIQKAFSNHHPTILMVFCQPFPSVPLQTNLPKIGHRYQLEKVSLNMLMIGQPMALFIIRTIIEAAHRRRPLPHQQWVLHWQPHLP
jgi:hypothetical protein